MSVLFAVLTPPGKAALATLACTGPGTWPLVQRFFQSRSGKPLPEQPISGQFWLGKLGQEMRDEAILAVPQVQPLVVEWHIHGGREVLRYLSELFEVAGARQISWEEFLFQTERDAIRAAALVALAQVNTLRAANLLLDQFHGALAVALAQMQRARQEGRHEEAEALKRDLLGRATLGLRLVEGFRVVIAGAPNVGKSSLLNALAGFQRSIVSPTPGTTRDVVGLRLALEGYPIDLSDTAGLRVGGETLESLGMAQAREAARQADLCLWLVDASSEPVWPQEKLENLRIVVNKCDLPAAWNLAEAADAPHISAATGEGIDKLAQKIIEWLVPEIPSAGAAIPFTREQIALIESL